MKLYNSWKQFLQKENEEFTKEETMQIIEHILDGTDPDDKWERAEAEPHEARFGLLGLVSSNFVF